MHLDGLVKIYVVTLLLAYCAGAGNVTKQELVGNIAKRGLSSSLHMSITEALYVAAVIIPSKEDPRRTVCSGVFLHEIWVATAASCFDGRSATALVIFGVDDYNAETGNQAGSIGVWLHPEYNATWLLNDIALIKVGSSTTQRDKYKIAKVYDYSYKYGDFEKHSCMGLGFGNNTHNDTVLHYNLYDVSYNPYSCGCNTFDKNSLCGKLQSAQEPCFTYKGGPLLCGGLVVGVASSMNPCGIKVQYNVCARQNFFRFTYFCYHFNWISQYVDNFPTQCNSWLSSAPAKAPLILHQLLFIIFIIIVCN